VVMAIHDLDLAARVADEVHAVRAGKTLAAGPVATVFTDAVLTRLFDTPARVVQDQDGMTVRFHG
jgi:iron complex transport system ATP-binding protein